MRDLTVGQYYPSNSVVHRADPRFKLLILCVYFVMVFFCDTFFSFAFVTVFVLVTVFIARVPLLKVLKGIRPVLIVLLFTTALMIVFYRDESAAPHRKLKTKVQTEPRPEIPDFSKMSNEGFDWSAFMKFDDGTAWGRDENGKGKGTKSVRKTPKRTVTAAQRIAAKGKKRK